MKVSLNTIKKYIDFQLPPVDVLIKRINEQLGGVDKVIDVGVKYKDALIIAVVKCEKHPDADRLSVCLIDDGGVVKDVERDEDSLITVVCGAPNVRSGMLAVWLPPQSIVPSTFDDKQPFVLATKELRGVVSNGMLAASDELALGNDHEGIVEITERDIADVEQYSDDLVGKSFAKIFGLDDTIIDIENKMFTHRPDLFGQLGVAREISAIIKGLPAASDSAEDTRFVNPEWYWQVPTFVEANSLELTVHNDVPEEVPRFMAVAMKNVEVKPSPLWLQCALAALGSKSINNVVDITNYMMLMTAQPVHAYDYDKLRGSKLGVRMARKDEKVTLLNGKTYNLTTEDIAIVDSEGIIGLGGVMGGSNSEVSSDTKNIVLEVATFDMYTVRKTSMRHGLFTDAVTRFNKGQSRLQNSRVLAHLMQLMGVHSGALHASAVADLTDGIERSEEESLCRELKVGVHFINSRLGIDLSSQNIGDLLRRTNFASYPSEDDDTALLITSPFWRTDIELPEDIVEEVGRLYGFDKLSRELPLRNMKPAVKNELRELKQSLRESLAKAGANEVLTYSFVHEKILRNVGQDPIHAYKLSNALSPDLQYYRLSLMSSLLDKVHMNVKAGFDEFALFEVGKVHHKGSMDPAEPSVPNEANHLALVLAYNDKHKPVGAPYYQARKFLEQIVDVSELELQPLATYKPEKDEYGAQLVAAYEPNRSATILCDGNMRGIIGEFRSSVRRAFKLPEFAVGFELHTDILSGNPRIYRPLSKFPSVMQDISLKVSTDVSYEALYDEVRAATSVQAEGIVIDLSPRAIYQAEDDTTTKTVTLRVNVTSHSKTLRDSDVNELLESVASRVKQSIGAERI